MKFIRIERNKIKNALCTILLVPILLLAFSNLALARDNNAEKLSEYDAFETAANAVTGMATASTVFNGTPFLVKLTKNDSNELVLETTKLANNYSDVKTTEFNLNKLLQTDVDYSIDLNSNANELFLLITNTEDNYRDNKNLLLKSNNGVDWILFKTFPAEWSLEGLEVNKNNLSTTCLNCEDLNKPAYIISSNNGKSWHKYSLPQAADGSNFSGVTNNRLFAVTTSHDPADRTKSIYDLYSNDITVKHANWVKSDIKDLLAIPATYNNKDVTYNFTQLTNIFDAEDVLLALAKYKAVTETTPMGDKFAEKYYAWVSKDNGITWDLLNIDLKDEVITQFSKTNSIYNLVTNKDISFLPSESDSDNDENDENDSNEIDATKYFSDILSFFEKQKYNYYQLSKEQLNSTSPVELKAKFEFNNSMGYNLNYIANAKTSYADTILVHNNGGNLMIEFYRLYNNLE